MRRVLLAAVLVASAAWAGTRFKVTTGAVPSGATAGVGLEGVVGCRASVTAQDSGVIAAGTIRYHYYDPNVAWTEASSSLDCTVMRQADGGTRTRFVCPDLPVAARYGRIAISGESVYANDGGASPNGHAMLADGGGANTVPPYYRLECWGPSVYQ